MASYSWRLLVLLLTVILVSCIEPEPILTIDDANLAEYSEPDVTADVTCTHMRWEEYNIACDGLLDNDIITGYVIFWLSDVEAKMCAYHTNFNTGIALLDNVFGQQVAEDWGCVTLSDYSDILPWSRTTAGVWIEWEGQRMELFAPEDGNHDFDGLIFYWRDFHLLR
jgi:hypothetical protein